MSIFINPYRRAEKQSTMNLRELVKKQKEKDKKNIEHIKYLKKQKIIHYLHKIKNSDCLLLFITILFSICSIFSH
jgi:hypothetical protein